MQGYTDEQIKQLQIVDKYKEVVIPTLKLQFKNLSIQEINEAVDYSLLKRMKNNKAVLHNNYKDKTLDTSLLEMTEFILAKMPIITSYGVIFKKHGELPNPIAKILDSFLNTRKMYKAEMFKYPKGSDEFEKYNLLQLLSKIDANSFIV